VPRRIAEARERVGLSQRRLGIEIDFDPSVASARINHYERGRHVPNFGVVAKIAARTGVPEAFFYAVDDDLAEVIALFGALPQRKRRKTLQFLSEQAPARAAGGGKS
jgi:transcriptional regulator with XRE-family HTH domain